MPTVGSVNATVVKGNATAQERRKIATEIGPRKMGLTINACFPVLLLFKYAASSKRHHNLCVQVGSHKISMTSEFFSKPAKLRIAWVFKVSLFWLMQIRSKKTFVLFLQKSITKVVAAKPLGRHQAEYWTNHWRSKPGRRPQQKKIIIKIAARNPQKTAAKPL